MNTEKRSQSTEEIQKPIEYNLDWIAKIVPQTYKIKTEELRVFVKNAYFGEPAMWQPKSFDNFNAYSDELKDIVIKLKQWNGQGLVAILGNGTGCGKTHLAIATARHYYKKRAGEWIEANKDKDFGYKDYAQQEFREMREHTKPMFFSELETYKVEYGNIEFNFWLKINRLVVIDDLFAGKQNETARAAIYEILNTRIINYNVPTIITSNLSLKEIGKQVDERIASRLQSNMTFEIQSAIDYRAK